MKRKIRLIQILMIASLLMNSSGVFAQSLPRHSHPGVAKSQTFKDPHDDFEFKMPAGVFKLQDGGGVNKFGQGVYLTSVDGNASVEAPGSVASSGNVATAMKDEIADHPTWNITTKTKGPNWFILSGSDGKNNFFQKTLVAKDKTQKSLVLYYPKTDSARYSPAAEMMSATFK